MAKAKQKIGDTGRLGRIQERFNQQVEQARVRLNDSIENVRGSQKTQAADYWDDAIDYVRENPGRIVAISALFGLALGAYLRFRR